MRVAVHYNQLGRGRRNRWSTTIRAGRRRCLRAAGRRARHRRHPRMRARDARAASAGIDVLVNNAGSLVKRVPIAEFDDALFDEVMHINARSVLAFCREVVPLMRRRARRQHHQRVVGRCAQRRRPGRLPVCGLQGLREHRDARPRQGTGARQHPRQRGGAGRASRRPSRTVLDAAMLEDIQGQDSDGAHRRARRLRGRLPLSRLGRSFRATSRAR